MTTKITAAGEFRLPVEVLERHGWSEGTRLVVEDCDDHVRLRAEAQPATTLDDVAGCLRWTGPTRSLDEMDEAIEEGARQWRSSR